MRYPYPPTPSLHNLCNDTTRIPDAQLGSSGSESATAPATQEGFGSETHHLSVNVSEARERARHNAESWKMDASAKAVLMFVSLSLQGSNWPYIDLVLISSKG